VYPYPTPARRLGELGEHLGAIAHRVREAVADAVGETVARIARDAVDGLLGRRPARPPPRPVRPPSRAPSDDYDPRADDPADDDDRWPAPRFPREEVYRPSPRVPAPRPAAPALAAALAGAGWGLRRYGTLPGALALGVLAWLVALLGGRTVRGGLGLFEAAARLLGLDHGLAAAADVLSDA
jgi:hypothetical protein